MNAAVKIIPPKSLVQTARHLLEQSGWDRDKALAALIRHVQADKSLQQNLLQDAALAAIRSAAADQRDRLVAAAADGTDDARGLEMLATHGYLATFLLIGGLKLGDAREEDLLQNIKHHQLKATSHKRTVAFLNAIQKNPKLKQGSRVKECFTEMGIATLAREFLC